MLVLVVYEAVFLAEGQVLVVYRADQVPHKVVLMVYKVVVFQFWILDWF